MDFQEQRNHLPGRGLESLEKDWRVLPIPIPVKCLAHAPVLTAEGNPDEEKIGAFGVGQLPCVSATSAGGETMHRILQLVFRYRRTMGLLGRYANLPFLTVCSG